MIWRESFPRHKKAITPLLSLEKRLDLLVRIEEYRGGLLTRLAAQFNLTIFIRSSELHLPFGQ